ncbi:trigger factor [Desulfovermiculus halophilus]|uniref:trigger factor n=1 Tax=Desulfovermiculus halophilus TaxID=339722 RepID=UPI00054E2D2F|nr:trigger factor [Desulfovermiculus halophilus]
MEYQVEDISPVEKKVTVQISAEEVNAALQTAVAYFKKDLKMDGFRQGKVPSSLVENKFRKEISDQATRDLLNVHFSQIFGELNLEPVAGIHMDDDAQLVRDQDLSYRFRFEYVPELDLPEYNGLQTTQKKVAADEDMVESALQRVQREQSSLELVKEDRKPVDGDVAVIDFTAYKDGEPLSDLQAKGFELPLGEGQALESFEEIVKELSPGQSGKGEVTFPEDFLNSDLAGSTVTMEVTLNVIKERKLPEADDDFADQLGFNSIQEVRDHIQKSFSERMERMERSAAQKRLLDQVLTQVDIPLPPSMVDSQLSRMMESKRSSLEKQGKSLESEGGEEAVRESLRPEAEEVVKSHVVLLDIAKREGLTVSNQEVEVHLYRLAINSGQDPQEMKQYYEQNNLMHALRDSLLADKAMERIYENAVITEEEADGDTADSPEEETAEK